MQQRPHLDREEEEEPVMDWMMDDIITREEVVAAGARTPNSFDGWPPCETKYVSFALPGEY